MNQHQFDDLTTILQHKANQRYDNTLYYLHYPGRCDDSLVEVIFEAYISYVDGINEVLRLIAEKQELKYSLIQRKYPRNPELNGGGENID